MNKQILINDLESGKTYLETKDGRVEITDPVLFRSFNNLAAYNAALGNDLEPSFWQKLFSFNQKAQQQHERPMPKSGYEAIAAESGQSDAKEFADREPDGWDGETPIYGGIGWC